MSYKEAFYTKVSKFNIQELQSFFESEDCTFDEFRKDYDSWISEEKLYANRLERLNNSMQSKNSAATVYLAGNQKGVNN